MRCAPVLRAGVALATAAALASCVRVPHTGAVVEAAEPGRAEASQQPYNNPPPPRPDARPDDIVAGFLDAMTATPLSTNRAGDFLTKGARAQWRPRRVLSYAVPSLRRRGSDVIVRLRGLQEVGAAGQWQGRDASGPVRITFPMARENGQWRIAAAPDALIVPGDFYDANYEDASLYFFDPTGRILVPEPVHVPQGPQLASTLVRALLRAPPTGSSSVARTFIPPGLTFGLSVPVNDYVAEVNLTGTDPGPLDRQTTRRMLAQLSWTLRQDPAINAFTLNIAGRVVTDVSGRSRFSVRGEESDPFDPAVFTASSQFYALRNGRLVSGQVTRPTRVAGPFGNEPFGIGSFAVDLDNTRVAGVTPDSLLVGPVLGDSQPTQALTGPDLLRPAWDFADRLWEVQNGPTGALVEYLAHGIGRPHEVRVPGITGEDVRRFLVSRDGSRIVALVHGSVGDRIAVSRLRYAVDGTATGATRARRIPWKSTGTTRIRDIGWTSPTTIAVLDQLSDAQAEMRILNVDGSILPDEAAVKPITGRVQGLATSPSQPPYAIQRGELIDLSQDQVVARRIAIEGLRHLTYAG
jgi:Lipoprotein LpqB beta-propeller domain/Sporulation and spore germination